MGLSPDTKTILGFSSLPYLPPEAREGQRCPLLLAWQPLPAAPFAALRRPHRWPELSRICWMSSSPPWQAAKILFTALKANSHSFLPPSPFFQNIKLLARSHHFLLSSVWPEPLTSGRGPEPAIPPRTAPLPPPKHVDSKASA